MKKKIIGTILLFLILSTITFKMPISEAANYYPSNSEIDNAINSIKSDDVFNRECLKKSIPFFF